MSKIKDFFDSLLYGANRCRLHNIDKVSCWWHKPNSNGEIVKGLACLECISKDFPQNEVFCPVPKVSEITPELKQKWVNDIEKVVNFEKSTTINHEHFEFHGYQLRIPHYVADELNLTRLDNYMGCKLQVDDINYWAETNPYLTVISCQSLITFKSMDYSYSQL